MWGAISKIFSKNNANCEEAEESRKVDVEMDRGEERRGDMNSQESYDTRQAKQRASIKWLLSKAFNNKVPENLKEPFYKDHENQEHLKPQIVGALANAEMYCLALGNIYSDPNYHNLNHWSILQTLARKGVYVSEPSDTQLTESTLIQTSPLKLTAHMAVIESIMILYAKEVVTPDRVIAAVQRFNNNRGAPPSTPENQEQGLLVWVAHACSALRRRNQQEFESGVSNGENGKKPPDIPSIKDFKGLCDGVALAALISYYCPEELPCTELQVSFLPSIPDSLHNLALVQDFCQRCLPASVFHMLPEDITYMRGPMKQNFIVFLADLFNVLEIHPVKCVRYQGMERSNEGFPARNAHGVIHKRNLPQSVMSPIPDLRSGLDHKAPTVFQVPRSTPTHVPLRKTNSLQQSVSDLMSEDSLRRGSEDSFVVYKSKNIPTLSTVIYDEPLVPARLRTNKEKLNHDSKADEMGEQMAAGKSDQVPAGRPSNWQEQKRPSYSGRRSRRNSVTEDSQLTIENFGGSQDNLNFIGRNPDKEVGAHVGRKISAPAAPIENPAVRSSLQDARSSILIGFDNGCEKNDSEFDNFKLKRQLSSDAIPSIHKLSSSQEKENILCDLIDGEVVKRMSFADLNKKSDEPKGIQLVYMQQDKEDLPSKSSFLNKSGNANGSTERKTTTFATLPNTTTWQQQSTNNQQNIQNNGNEETSSGNNVMASQLNDIRMKLEEKRRHIENEKRRMEVIMNKQRQKVGKAAFLQAVTKGKGSILKTASDSETSSAASSAPRSPTSDVGSKPQRPFTLQEINDDASTVEKKWLEQDQPFIETRKTPDIENMDLDQYHQSIAQMNSSLHDIQADIQRLASQQSQIQVAQQNQYLMQQRPPYQPPPNYNIQQYQPQVSVYNPLQSYSSAPHLPQAVYSQQFGTSPQPEQPHFYLHDQSPITLQPQRPQVPQRRTWAQQPQPQSIFNESAAPEYHTWAKPPQNVGGFILHESADRFENSRYQPESPRYQNGEEYSLNRSNSHPGFTLSQQHMQQIHPGAQTSPSTSPQHRNIHKQISQLLDDSLNTPVNLQQMDVARKSSVIHAPIPAPSADDMEPQNISFIGNPEDHLKDIREGISRLNITSGSRTYRIPSPTRTILSRNAFQPSPPIEPPISEVSSLEKDSTGEKGFYITFDNEQPKRPKPPLRTKRGSPRKEKGAGDAPDESNEIYELEREKQEKHKLLARELEAEQAKAERQLQMAKLRERRDSSIDREKIAAASAIIIGNDLSNPDPDTVDERERKKEKIMLMSLQRRQQQEEAKQRKENEAQVKREREKAKEEERQRKKEEQIQRRAVILEQYKLKKAIDEAEREGKVIDKADLASLRPTPKLRPKGSTTRPRPKTIHIDSGSVEMAEGMLQPSRGKKGSSSNLTANNYNSSTMRRDYYRGSQDSLSVCDRGMGSGTLYKDSPDDSRGMSPCHSANQTLGRRGSYKTSRDPSPAQVRGRTKYPTYKGRKSSSMMNLYGSSVDQDSFAYRYGDTDSGLGRATPPRRAPSPGMGPMRHLPSPSGPGSLPGLAMSKRRIFDDGSSDISSTPSSMMDYTGPRLYKQPTTKSNRSIILNAVEYCVFPGVVNRDAKNRVLEEITRSEAKHFLILFRDAGCQFRALYSYCPEREEVIKMYGTGPKQVNDRMFDKFFKYNSGGKCFSQVHTKHLTVTIDAFTIHNSLWQGKKVNLPSKKDMTLVI